jgi:hypothetical protein
MKKLIEEISNLSLTKFTAYLFILGYVPIIFLGYFIQDDFGIVMFRSLEIGHATEWMCTVNNNRPLSCVYFSLITRIWPVFWIYFLLILTIYFYFIHILLKTFNFLIDDIFLKKLFVIFLIFPFFSYTIFYSPAMQGIGALSLLLWSLSLYFLKKYIDYKSYKYLTLSYFLVLIMFLTYESASPLLGISFFFPLLFKKNKLFVFNSIIIIFIMLLILYLQKKVFPAIFDIDLSRIKFSSLDIKKLMFLILINIMLTFNIIFHSIEIFFQNIFYSIKKFDIMLLLHISTLSLFYFAFVNSNKKIKFIKFNKSNKKRLSIIYLFMIFSVIFLNILMHALADTGMEFIKYDNRALTSISVIVAFIIILSLKFIKNNFKKQLLNMSFILFIILISNFLFFQHNLIKERFQAILTHDLVQQRIFKSNNTQSSKIKLDDQVIIFIVLDREKIYELMSYNSFDYFDKVSLLNQVFVEINDDKYCNDSFYQPNIKKAYIDRYSKFILLKADNKQNGKSFTNFYVESEAKKQVEEKLEEIFICNKKRNIKNNKINNGKNIYLDDRYYSLFIRAMIYIYNRVIH